ncbi:cilia- and flagella-associated protein 97 isoform X2 [Cyrtonyx montezumae]|uniref:cilia- and flagella-associated protein 97 isoform X2 n=1 Tax=Cyrtonyx montezumae TaxID=9017 RepID=UPI0032DA5201
MAGNTYFSVDRFEDASDGEVDHTFYESDFAEEKETEENGQCIEKGNTKVVLSDPDLIASSKDANCCEEESEEKQEDLWKNQNSTDNPEDASSLSLPPVCENAGTSGATSAASRRMQENVPAEIDYTDVEDSSNDGKKQKIRLESAKQSYNVGRASETYSTTSSSSSSSSSDSDSDSSLSDSLHSSSKRSACSSILLYPEQKCGSAIRLPKGKQKPGDCVEQCEDTAAPQLENKEQQELTVGHPSRRMAEDFSADKELRHCSDFKAALELRDKRRRKLSIAHPSRGMRKNYSFSNEEVRRIDQENQRLLQELARLYAMPGSRTDMLRKSASPYLQVYHSAINRQKEQRRIEKENLALLKRLTAVKPTPGLRRSEQLWDYQRYVSYVNISPSGREQSSLSRQRGLSRNASRACTASSIVRQKKEKPMSASPTGASQRPKSTKAHSACLK